MDFVLKICRRVHRSATACGCLGDGKRTLRPGTAGVLRADGTGNPRRPGTDLRHPGTGLQRCAPTSTPPKPTQTGPGHAGCPTGRPTGPRGVFLASRPTPRRRQSLRVVVPQRPIRPPSANTAADPVAARRPSPTRERNKITPNTAHQAVDRTQEPPKGPARREFHASRSLSHAPHPPSRVRSHRHRPAAPHPDRAKPTARTGRSGCDPRATS